MKTLPRGEASSVVIQVKDENTVFCSHTVKPTRDSEVRVFIESWTFDFTGITRNELLELAVKTCKIIKQRDWGKSPDRNKPKVWDHVTFKVRDIIDEQGKRGPADPVKQADSAIEKMNAEQLKAFIAKAQAKLTK